MDWISVKDRLPTKEECEKNCGWFLVMRPKFLSRPALAKYNGPEHGWKYAYDYYITHWMSLPEKPEE